MIQKILFTFGLSALLFSWVYADSETAQASVSFMERMKFFLILVPAAVWDSINPCAFAVMIILLTSILKEQKSRYKVLLAWFLFVLAIFISYTAMWIGLYSALASTERIFYLKLFIWIIWILVGLANLKDYFWYGKGFRMEVPTSWRPLMKKLLKRVVSPMGAFFIWFIISLFLLPCTSGPYFVVLGYLAAESADINMWGYMYIIIYNIIFIIPMVIIAIMIAFKYKWADELEELKELNVEKMHLITWIIMLALGFYILSDILI